MHHHAPPKSTIEDIARPLEEAPNAYKASASAVVVQCWCDLVSHMDRQHLDRFARSIWRRFDERDLEPLKWAIIRRRRILARQEWP